MAERSYRDVLVRVPGRGYLPKGREVHRDTKNMPLETVTTTPTKATTGERQPLTRPPRAL